LNASELRREALDAALEGGSLVAPRHLLKEILCLAQLFMQVSFPDAPDDADDGGFELRFVVVRLPAPLGPYTIIVGPEGSVHSRADRIEVGVDLRD
jgi:hypothetical protein